jgi:diguanylate cyclase (GGDEF)-like protein/PAS domain S-box-containing protein
MLLLLALMVCVAVLSVLAMAWMLYREAIEEHRWWLETLLREEASLISAVDRIDREHLQQRPGDSLRPTLSRLIQAREQTGEFGQTGEVVIGRRKGGEIEFLLGRNFDDVHTPAHIQADSIAAEPMRRALAGETGSLIGSDYRGVMVIAAYQPLPDTGMGIVAKIDLSEIRAPLARDIAVGGFGALMIIALGTLFARRLSAPMTDQLQSVVENLNEAQHTAGLGSWVRDIRTGDEEWSDELFRILGYGPNEIRPTYKNFLHAVHPDDRDRVEEAVKLAVKAHEPYQLDLRIQQPNGELRRVEAQGVVHRDAGGRPVSMTGTVLDITDRMRLEQILERERVRSEEFLRISQAIIVGLDKENRVTLINPRGCEILGYDKRELLGKNWFETVVTRDVRDELMNKRRASQHGAFGFDEYEEYAIVTRTGKRRYIAWHNTERRNSDGVIIGCLNSGVDVTSLKLAEETSRHMASHDALTGLPNRILFNDRLQQAMAKAQRENNMVGLLYLDLNEFKPVNDTLGHAIGDQLLIEVAERLRQTLREVDTVARMGGDEFTVILGGITDRDVAMAMADKIAINLARPFEIPGGTIRIGASVGTALYPVDANTVDSLLAMADDAMYAQKRLCANVSL